MNEYEDKFEKKNLSPFAATNLVTVFVVNRLLQISPG